MKGWCLGRGCALPVGGLGACPRKKINFCAKNYAILSKFWYFFPILQHKVGGLSPSPKSGGPIALSPPPAPTPMVLLEPNQSPSGYAIGCRSCNVLSRRYWPLMHVSLYNVYRSMRCCNCCDVRCNTTGPRPSFKTFTRIAHNSTAQIVCAAFSVRPAACFHCESSSTTCLSLRKELPRFFFFLYLKAA